MDNQLAQFALAEANFEREREIQAEQYYFGEDDEDDSNEE